MSERYHGKVLIYNPVGSTGTNEFVKQLPHRAQFIKKDAKLHDDIKNGRSFFFRSNSQIERHVFIEGRQQYQLILIGTIHDGTKTAIMVNGITPWFEVRIPDSANPYDFAKNLMDKLREVKMAPPKYEVDDHKPFMFYQEADSSYVRLNFNTSYGRKKCIEYVRNTLGLETANDDTSCYYRVASRTYNIPLCDWFQVSAYVRDTDDPFIRAACVPYVFNVNVDKLRTPKDLGIDFTTDPVYRDYLIDRTLNMLWDTETHDFYDTGRAPNPEDTSNGIIFMDSCSFAWNYTSAPCVTVNQTLMPQPARDDCMIIVCRNQSDIICLMSILIGRMAPEFIVGFNDGAYDWPFILRRAEMLGIKDTMSKFTSVLTHNDDNKKYHHRGENKILIKVEADKYMDYVHYEAAGFYCVDTKIVFQQLNPTSDSNSLNFFLAENKLGQKVDMPIPVMFKTYRTMASLRMIYETLDWAEIMARLTCDRDRFGPEYKLFNQVHFGKLAPHTLPNGTPYHYGKLGAELYKKIGQMTIAEIFEYTEKSTLVAHYCNVDSILCHKLLQVRNIIADRREKAILSWTSMHESLFRADGVRIRNLVIHTALKKEWNIACSNISQGMKDGRKYPGAYVVPPKRGLYRDHSSIKLKRVMDARGVDGYGGKRDDYIEARNALAQFTAFDVDPASPCTNRDIFDLSLAASLTDEEIANIDTNGKSGRPCFGVDANSLYPSEDMNYNFSPEKAIISQKFAEELTKKIDPATGKQYVLEHVKFPYGRDSDEIKEEVEGWFVQHDPSDKGMGIYPAILKMLFDMRKQVKKKMEHYQGPLQFLAGCKTSGRTDRASIIQFAENELAREQALFDTAPQARKKYFSFRVAAAKHNLKFLREEWPKASIPEPIPGDLTPVEPIYVDFETFFAECSFWFAYYNSKQLTLKVFMNSFYGETGNVLSPFFIVLVAGGITTHGQMTIKAAKQFVEDIKKCDVHYGDTDSLYVSPPEETFTKIDDDYINARITKLEYWTQMVEASMEYADQLIDDVNNFLYEMTGMRYLRMAYEEVLWPYAFLGRKKYIGIQHQGIANFSICMPSCSLKDFMKSKLLFIRGLEVKKRGSSELLKLATYGIMKDAFCIDNVETMQQIVLRTLNDIGTKQFEPEHFVKSGNYKAPKPGKPGNVTFNRFVDRMTDVSNKWPECGIRAPEMSERFKYVVVKRFPWVYDIRGRKTNIRIGDKLEYATSLANPAYIDRVRASRNEDLQIDRDYYIRQELIGQFARFLTYHPAYDISTKEEVDIVVTDISGKKKTKRFKRSELEEEAWRDERPDRGDMPYPKAEQRAVLIGEDTEITGNDDNNDKLVDKASHAYAKKVLLSIFDARFAQKYEDRSNIYKTQFRDVNKTAIDQLGKRYGSSSQILDIANQAAAKAAGAEDNLPEISNAKLITTIRKRITTHAANAAKKYADLQLITDSKIGVFKLGKLFHKSAGIFYTRRITFIERELLDVYNKLDACMPEFEELCSAHVDVLRRLIDNPNNIAIDEATGIEYSIEPEWLPESAVDIMNRVYDIYVSIVSLEAMRIELNEAQKQIAFKKAKSIGANPIPPGIKPKAETAAFANWFDKHAKPVNKSSDEL